MNPRLNVTDAMSFVGAGSAREQVYAHPFAAKGRSYSLLENFVKPLALLACLSSPTLAAELSGELDWASQVTLSVPVTGRVKQLAVHPGEAVEAGQLLMQLDTRIVLGQLEQARSAVKHHELQRAEAQREWDRAKELYDRTVLSERELQVAEIGFATADADYQAARASLVTAEVTLEDHSLKAPVAAWVLAIHVTPGEAVVNVSQATPLMTLAERGKMTAHASLNAAQAAAVQTGSSVKVRVNDQQYDAQVIEVGVEPLSAERPALYSLVVEFIVPSDAALRAGQAATLILP